MTKKDWLDTLTDEAYEAYEDLNDQIKAVEDEIEEITEILRNPADSLDDWDYETKSDVDRYVDSLQDEAGHLELKLDELYKELNAFEADNGFKAA